MIVVATGRTGSEDKTAFNWREFPTRAEKFDQPFRSQSLRRARMKPSFRAEARHNRVTQRRNRIRAAGFNHHVNDFVTMDRAVHHFPN